MLEKTNIFSHTTGEAGVLSSASNIREDTCNHYFPNRLRWSQDRFTLVQDTFI